LKLGKRKLLDTLVFDSGTLERLCDQSETLQNEISFLNEQVKRFGKEVLFMRKMRREHLLGKRRSSHAGKSLLRTFHSFAAE